MNVQDHARLGLFAHEKGKEFDRQVDEAREIGSHLGMERGQIHFRRLGEVDLRLSPCVQEDAVQVRISGCDTEAISQQAFHGRKLQDTEVGDQLLYERIHVLSIGHVKFCGTDFVFPMFADKVIESVLSTTHGDDFGAYLDEMVGHCGADTRCGTDEENLFV